MCGICHEVPDAGKSLTMTCCHASICTECWQWCLQNGKRETKGGKRALVPSQGVACPFCRTGGLRPKACVLEKTRGAIARSSGVTGV